MLVSQPSMATLTDPRTAEAVGVSVGEGVASVGVSLGVIGTMLLVGGADWVATRVGLAETMIGVPVWIEGVRDGSGADGL